MKREEHQGNPVRDEQGNLMYTDIDEALPASAEASASGPRPQNGDIDLGSREANGAQRRASGTMADTAGLSRLAGEHEHLRRSSSGSEISSSSGSWRASAPSSMAKGDVGSTLQNTAQMNQFLYNIHSHQQQQRGGDLKSFPSRGFAESSSTTSEMNLVPSAALEQQVNLSERPGMGYVDIEQATAPPAEPERPIAPRGRRSSIGQLF